MLCGILPRLGSAIFVSITLVCLVTPATVLAQFQTNVYTLTPEEKTQLSSGCDHLRQTLKTLHDQARTTGKPVESRIADAEIYLQAVDRNLQQNLFFSKQNVDQAAACLKSGEMRAEQLKENQAPWLHQTGVVVLGYYSRVDGSAQPYQGYIPANYDFNAPKPLRLDVFLHGRGGNLNELNFIRGTGWIKGDFGGTLPDFLALYPYGRGNNGWRYAGETDVFEALADFKSRFPADENLTSLRGFSMGGHGAFHIGLHYPGIWSVVSPGAGFVDTKQYLKLTAPMPDWQESLLHLYDAVDVAANAKNVPLIDYVGELDPKLPQYRLMAEALKKEEAPATEIIAANTEHRYEAKSLQTILQTMSGCRRNPSSAVDFVTYTLRYPDCKWVHITALEKQWQRSEVHANVTNGNLSLTTQNVAGLRLTSPGPEVHLRTSTSKNGQGFIMITIDGQKVLVAELRTDVTHRSDEHLVNLRGDRRLSLLNDKPTPSTVSLVKRSGHWKAEEITGNAKKPGLQGPIDDALFGPTLAVAGSGTAWNADAGRWTQQELERFRTCWGRYFRGTLPETTDAQLTPEQIHDSNLYLFGDPGSNAVLRRLLPSLPLRWTKETITIKGKTFSTKDHLPMLIFPNPENPQRYIVIDTGMTFSRADQEGSNGAQYPHLPDYAVIRFDADKFNDDRKKDTEFAGFFNEAWQ